MASTHGDLKKLAPPGFLTILKILKGVQSGNGVDDDRRPGKTRAGEENVAGAEGAEDAEGSGNAVGHWEH